MIPENQLVKRIEKLQHFIAHKLKFSLKIGGEINYEIELLKSFLKGYKLVKKGNLDKAYQSGAEDGALGLAKPGARIIEHPLLGECWKCHLERLLPYRIDWKGLGIHPMTVRVCEPCFTKIERHYGVMGWRLVRA